MNENKRMTITLIMLAVLAACFTGVLLWRAVEYMQPQTPTEGVVTTGLVTAGPYYINIFEEDGQTMLIEIQWGTLSPPQTVHHSAWMFSVDELNHTGDQSLVNIKYWSDEPEYFDLVAYRDYGESGWYPWPQNTSRTFPDDGWLHVDFILSVEPGAATGPFQFTIWLETW